VKPRTHKQGSTVIVYDADRIQHPGPELFDPDHWRALGAVTGEAPGRGSALFLETPYGAAVLRRYLRGGVPAKISRDRYFFNGWERSRPLGEFHMLADLATHGLPVPLPLAAMCQRSGPFYTGWLMTRLLPGALTFADLIGRRADDSETWVRAGACIRRFHDFGVIHADLNARNILVNEEKQVFLIDFDRARVRRGDARAQQSNLDRLRRSLLKFWPAQPEVPLAERWQGLLQGYEESAASRSKGTDT
jgi:3-deoxy-D-manno-octulosonic acid kinase